MAQGFPYTTWPTDDVIVQEGTFAFDFIASGTIYAGQAVEPIGTMQVRKITNALGTFVGLAAYDATDTQHVAVYGPGNIVRACASGTSVTVGRSVIPNKEGKFRIGALYYASGISAISLEAQATADGSVRLLLH